MTIEIICPLYKAEKYIEKLHKSLIMQEKVNISNIKYIVTKSNDNTTKILDDLNMGYEEILSSTFSHSLTRENAAKKSNADIIVFITQDIVIKDKLWLYFLTKDIEEGSCEATYSRQIAKDNGIEKYTRERNYPEQSRIFTKKLLNNELEDFYIDFMNEMKKGFSTILVSDDDEIENMCNRIFKSMIIR